MRRCLCVTSFFAAILSVISPGRAESKTDLTAYEAGELAHQRANIVRDQAAADAKKTTAQFALDKECSGAVAGQLKADKGEFTAAVRQAYLRWAEHWVLSQLEDKNESVPDDCLKEVRADPAMRDAIFGSVYPPDPSILQNYATIRGKLSADQMQRYRSLAIAVAVAKRIKGVETESNKTVNFGHDYQPGFWTDETLRNPSGEDETKFISAIADFMKSSQISAAALYRNPGDQSSLMACLRQAGIGDKWISQVKPDSVDFGRRLMYAMVLLGQRPRERDPKPDTIAWMNYLIAQQQEKPKSTPVVGGTQKHWPLFRIDKAPWPLLMPLAHPVPFTEAKFIWEKFQGEHGTDRWHNYGPWRNDDGAMPYMLNPSTWFWDAWPDRIVWGGECVPISKGTVDMYSSLGKPAMWAGQPGHANLVTFDDTESGWTATIEQAFAGGPDVTFCQWYFNEDHGTEARHRDLYDWAGTEYPLGLSLAMNTGLSSYMDTRIAVNIFRSLPAEEKQTLGVKLLNSVVQTNPFNPQTWYLLGEQTGGGEEGRTIARQLILHAETAPASKELQRNTREYWQTVQRFEADDLLGYALPQSETNLQQSFKILASTPGIPAQKLAEYLTNSIETGSNEHRDALQFDQNLAADGDRFGELRMGMRYRDGAGVSRNDLTAKDWLLKAALQGDFSASQMLCDFFAFVPEQTITVQASSVYSGDQDPSNLINGKGMNGLLHDNAGNASTMWQTVENPQHTSPGEGINPSPAWVKFDFQKPTKFDSMLIWNDNQRGCTDRDVKTAGIFGSVDGKNWIRITSPDPIELERANGNGWSIPMSVTNTVADKAFKSVAIVAASNFGAHCFGLSAVRFVAAGSKPTLSSDAIHVTISSQYSPQQAAAHLIDGTGMRDGLHDNEPSASSMWTTQSNPPLLAPAPGLPPTRAWIRFDFSSPQKLDGALIWNLNQHNLTDRGFCRTHIYGTTDGRQWFALTNPAVIELPRASGQPDQEATQIQFTSGKPALRSIIIAADKDHGNFGSDIYGLSAVRLLRAAH